MSDSDSLEPGTEDLAGDSSKTPLDQHQDFIRRIDDASRMGYSALGTSTLAIPVSIVLLSGVKVLSLTALAILLCSALLVIVLGRLFVLSIQDRRLRRKVELYCGENDVQLAQLVKLGIAEERYEFFVKLFTLGRPKVDESSHE